VGCLLFRGGLCGVVPIFMLGLFIASRRDNPATFFVYLLFGGGDLYPFYKYIFWALVTATVAGLFLKELYPPTDE
jgi:hypothetical protein